MNIDKLIYLVEVVKYGSISAASEKLHITPSALSQAISSLEKEFGNNLFIRHRKKITLTSFGESVLSSANHLLGTYQEFIAEVQTWNQSLKGDISIATIPGLTPILIKVIASIKTQYPDINIFLEEKGTTQIYEGLVENKIDIGILNIFKPGTHFPDLNVDHLIDGHMQVLYSRHNFPIKEGQMNAKLLLNRNIMVYEDEAIDWFIKIFEQKYGPLNIIFKTNNVDAIRVGLQEGLGVAVGVDYCIKYELSLFTRNKALYIKDFDIPVIQLCLVHPKNKEKSPILGIFLALFKDFFSTSDFV